MMVTVAAKPRSGTTWLCSILAELCDGSTPVGNYKRKATSGWRVVRTHSAPEMHRNGDYGIVVLTKRDPRDMVCSMKRSWPNQEYERHAAGVIAEWGAMLEAWRERDPAPIETSYEALRADGVAEVQRLAREVFGLDVDETEAYRCLAAYVPDRMPSDVGNWMTELDEETISLIHSTIGDLMEAEGYAIS